MDALRILEQPKLDRPVLVAAFRGWNDGGQGATLAVGYLARLWQAQRFAEIDPEEFYDFQVSRPQVTLVDGATRHIDWPENAFFHAQMTGTTRDAVLMLGIEPNLRWRAFTEGVMQLAESVQAELVVTMGALLADVPHTRPAPVTGAATDPELVKELGLQQSRYEGPTGIVGVLHDACRRAGIPSVSLWAAVPHYVNLVPSPRAARALCERLGSLLEVPIDVAELAEAEETYQQQVSEAVSADPETAQYVEELEHRADTLEAEDISGDALAAELTRFLRDHERRKRDDEGT